VAKPEPKAVEQFHGILAFIADDSDFDFEVYVDRLRQAFPRRDIRSVKAGRDRAVEIASKRWQVLATLVSEPHFAEESREMAEWHSDHPLSTEIAECRRRVEFEGTDVRTESKCYANMLRACEVLASFSGVVVFDLERGKKVGE